MRLRKKDEADDQTLEDLRGKKIAVVTGSITEQMLLSYYGKDVEVCYYNSNADMAEALEADKTDAYCACIVDCLLQCEVYTDQRCLSDVLDSVPVAYFFPKDADGDALCAQMSEFIASEERQKSATFSDPTHYNNFVLTVKGASAKGAASRSADSENPQGTDGSVFTRLAASFEKTFIMESRWKLFLGGIGTTLLITVLAIAFGTLLGYAVYMACRSGNKAVIRVTDACMWPVNGMPTVVLLMLLFYVVFGASSLSGTWVAVIAYALIFAVGFTAMLRQTVDSLDPGQLEAAYALGYTKTAAFNKRILPQTIQRMLPAYKAQTVALIKSTAIVGYIAVQDLTKAGDIIRSRTFEAFFLIVATALFYFLMAALLSTIVRGIQIGTDPKRRTREQILKGAEK